MREDRLEFKMDFTDTENDSDIDPELLKFNLLMMSTPYVFCLTQIEKDIDYDKFLNGLEKSKALNQDELRSYFFKTFPSIEEFAKTKDTDEQISLFENLNTSFRNPTGLFKDHLLEMEKRVKKLLN